MVEVDSMDVMDGIEAIEAIEVTEVVEDEGIDGIAEGRLPLTETVTEAVLVLLEWPVALLGSMEGGVGEEGASPGCSGVRCLVFLILSFWVYGIYIITIL